MKFVTKGIALAAALLCTVSAVPFTAAAEGADAASAEPVTATAVTAATEAKSAYESYRENAPQAADSSVELLASAFSADKSAGVTPQADADYGTVYRLDADSTAAFTVTVPADASYGMSVIFANLLETAETYEIDLTIDGANPFAGCEKLSFNALWRDDGDIRQLSNGDQVTPAQKQVEGFVSQPLADADGLVLAPYEFTLTAGVHTISVTALGREFLLAGLRLDVPERLRPYAEVAADYAGVPKYTGEQIVIEGEAPYQKNAYALSSKADGGSASVSPHSPEQSLINNIGGDTWSGPNQEISWQVDVPETGLYKLGFAFKQTAVTNGSVYRWLRVDGKTPFAEASEIGFGYKVGWQFQTLGEVDSKGKPVEDYLIYLEKGTHTLSLSVTLSDIAEVFDRLAKVVFSLGDLYLDIVMITSDSPDANRDYELHKQIPDFQKILTENKELLDQLDAELGVTLQTNGELSGAVRNMSRILGNMLSSLYNAHLYVSTYYSAHQTLSAWLYDIKKMSLSLDQMILAAPDAAFETPQAGGGENFLFGLRRFFHSFTRTSTAVASGDAKTMPTIKIWVNWGRDQVKVLNTLIQDSFTPENNVNVRVEQVNATLVQGVISGNSPDLYLHMARTEPVNLAMRGVLYNLKNFDDYEDVLKNFQEGAETPYLYRDGCYALPDTQAFYVMFYRTDLLAQLGVKVPKTWDEFTQATGILQRNNMNTYLPYTKIVAATTVNTGAGGLSIFPTMLLQKGGSMYNEEKTATALTSQAAISAFTFWTDFYTKYSLDQEANFFQKFRVGTAPLGIAPYTQYLTFKVAAPEIDGKWAIAEIPGDMQDGVLNNACSGSGTGCSIMKSSKEKEAAWKFIKWWVSSNTQYRYSAECEAILGESGRTASANVDAVSRLSWDSASLKVILAQWSKVDEIPEVPGSYFVSRSIDQAFWATKNGKKSGKEAIVDWSEICDKEVARKIAEYADKDPDGE